MNPHVQPTMADAPSVVMEISLKKGNLFFLTMSMKVLSYLLMLSRLLLAIDGLGTPDIAVCMSYCHVRKHSRNISFLFAVCKDQAVFLGVGASLQRWIINQLQNRCFVCSAVFCSIFRIFKNFPESPIYRYGCKPGLVLTESRPSVPSRAAQHSPLGLCLWQEQCCTKWASSSRRLTRCANPCRRSCIASCTQNRRERPVRVLTTQLVRRLKGICFYWSLLTNFYGMKDLYV